MLDGFNTSVNGFKAGSRRDMTLDESLARTWEEVPFCCQIGFFLGTFDHRRT